MFIWKIECKVLVVCSWNICLLYLVIEKDEIHLEEDKGNLQSRSENVEYIAARAETIIHKTYFKESSHLDTDINETSNTKD